MSFQSAVIEVWTFAELHSSRVLCVWVTNGNERAGTTMPEEKERRTSFCKTSMDVMDDVQSGSVQVVTRRESSEFANVQRVACLVPI